MSCRLDFRVCISLSVLVATIVLTYAVGLSGGFVFDDFLNILENQQLQLIAGGDAPWWSAAWSGSAGPLARPVPMLLLGAEVSIFGFDPRVMKSTNVAIHILNAGLIFALVWRLCATLQNRGLLPAVQHLQAVWAMFTAAAWALAPINLTGVLYVVQRMESLSTFFMLVALLAYLHGRQLIENSPVRAVVGWRWVWLGLLGGGALAVFSKEGGVMLPLYALLLEWLVFGGGPAGSETRRRIYWLYALVLVLPGVMGLLWLGPGIWLGSAYEHRPFSLGERLWTEARVLWDYMRWTLLPPLSELSLYHDAYPVSRGPLSPPTGLAGALGLLVLVCTAYGVRKRWPWLSLGVLWFLVMHLLVSTVIGLELVYEHRNYMGALGLYLALGGVLLLNPYTLSRQRVAIAAMLGILALYAGLTHLRAREWSEPVKHAYFESQRKPESVRAAYYLGLELLRQSPEPDLPGFSDAVAAIERAAQVSQPSLLPFQAILILHGRHGWPGVNRWWELAYNYVDQHTLGSQDINALASLLKAQVDGTIHLDPVALSELYRRAYERYPRRVDLLTMRADALLNLEGRFKEGGELLSRAAVLAPRSSQVWANLIDYQLATGQLELAAFSLERMRELNRQSPNSTEFQALLKKYPALAGRQLPFNRGEP